MFTSVNPNNSRLDSGGRSKKIASQLPCLIMDKVSGIWKNMEKLGSLHILNLLALFVGVLLWLLFFALLFWFEGATNSQDHLSCQPTCQLFSNGQEIWPLPRGLERIRNLGLAPQNLPPTAPYFSHTKRTRSAGKSRRSPASNLYRPL